MKILWPSKSFHLLILTVKLYKDHNSKYLLVVSHLFSLPLPNSLEIHRFDTNKNLHYYLRRSLENYCKLLLWLKAMKLLISGWLELMNNILWFQFYLFLLKTILLWGRLVQNVLNLLLRNRVIDIIIVKYYFKFILSWHF